MDWTQYNEETPILAQQEFSDVSDEGSEQDFPFIFPPHGWVHRRRHGSHETRRCSLEREDDCKPKSWSTRICAPMSAGSERSGILTMIVSAVGAGILSLPFVFSSCGLLLGFIILCVGGALAALTLELLVACGDHTGILSYSELTQRVFGRRVASLVEGAMIVYCFGATVGYLIIMGDSAHGVVAVLLDAMGSETTSVFASSSFVLVYVSVLVVLPLKCMKSVAHLRYASVLSVSSVFYVTVAIIIRAVIFGPPSSGGAQDSTLPMACWECTRLVKFSWKLPQSIAIMFFAFASHINFFPVFGHLHRPTVRRITKVTRRSVMVEICLYAMFSCFAYLSFHDQTHGNILLNYALHDPLFVAGRLAMVVSLAVVCPLILAPAHHDINRLFFKGRAFSWVRHLLVSVLLVAAAVILAIFIPEVSAVFSVLGATFAVLFCHVLPILLYVQIIPASICPRRTKTMLLSVLAVVVVIAVVAVIQTVQSLLI